MTAASSVGAARGGLSRAYQALSERPSPWATEPKPCRPRAVPVRAWGEPETEQGSGPLTTSSSSSGSVAAVGPASASREAEPAVAPDAASLEAGLAELRALFAGSCSLGTSAPGFGVSPPVRSGAANGLVHDSLWRAEAPRACKASLRALQERAGPRALDSCAGDYRLLMASPDQGLALLAGALEEDDEDGACPMGMSLGTSAGGAFMDEALPGRRLPPSAARSRASSRASPAPGGWCGAASVPAHSPSPDPDASLLFSY